MTPTEKPKVKERGNTKGGRTGARVPKTTYELDLPDEIKTEVNQFTGRTVPLIPKGFHYQAKDITPAEVVGRFHLAFELIGGVERFALWADANPTDFYKLYGKLLPAVDVPQATAQAIQINLSGGAAFPHSPLDNVELRAENVTDVDFDNGK